MSYLENINEILKDIESNNLEIAQSKLENMFNEEKIKDVESENSIYYTFNNYIEKVLFYDKYKPTKELKYLNINISEIYYYLGRIKIQSKNYGEALEYFDLALKWNPVDISIMFLKAKIYRELKQIERFKAEIEKTYQYIYTSKAMASYYNELGWYYTERGVYDLANALYTASLTYAKTEMATSELNYIAKQTNREVRESTQEEIEKLLEDYNIPLNLYKHVFDIIYKEYNNLMKNEPTSRYIFVLANALYDITLDKRFLGHLCKEDKELGVSIKIPSIWRYIDKEDFAKYHANNMTFLIQKEDNRMISAFCVGRCSKEEAELKYQQDIKALQARGSKLLKEYRYAEGKILIQTITEMININNQVIRILHNYIISNGYLFDISWQVQKDYEPDDIITKNANSLEMEVVLSLKKIETIQPFTQTIPTQKSQPIKQEKVNENITEKVELKEYSMKIEGFPKFKFYFPGNLGEYKVTSSNVFELMQGKITKIRVGISKCSSRDKLEEKANKWIETTKSMNDMEEVEHRKETIDNIPLEVYILKYKNKPKLANKIYKSGYVNGYRVTISGALVDNREQIINQAFKTMKMEENEQENKKIESIQNTEVETKVEQKIERKPIIINCPVCNNEFQLNWNVPSSEKVFYCRCPKCNAEIKHINPNYKE